MKISVKLIFIGDPAELYVISGIATVFASKEVEHGLKNS